MTESLHFESSVCKQVVSKRTNETIREKICDYHIATISVVDPRTRELQWLEPVSPIHSLKYNTYLLMIKKFL